MRKAAAGSGRSGRASETIPDEEGTEMTVQRTRRIEVAPAASETIPDEEGTEILVGISWPWCRTSPSFRNYPR